MTDRGGWAASDAGGSPTLATVLDVAEICPPGSAIRRELVACLAQMFREAVGEQTTAGHAPSEAPASAPIAAAPAGRQPRRHGLRRGSRAPRARERSGAR